MTRAKSYKKQTTNIKKICNSKSNFKYLFEGGVFDLNKINNKTFFTHITCLAKNNNNFHMNNSHKKENRRKRKKPQEKNGKKMARNHFLQTYSINQINYMKISYLLV